MSTVEQRVVRAAIGYAEANGYHADDRTAVGLVLVGMAIAAACSTTAQAELLRGYLADFPAEADKIRGWAAFIDSPDAGAGLEP